MDFLPVEIQKYVEDHTQPESDLLQKINRETHLQVLRPRMLSGHLQGRVLSALSKMIRPKRILEIGTYTGYATICLAEGLTDDGRIWTIEINEELKGRVEQYYADAGIAGKVNFIIGHALEIIPTLKESWDLVFIDADKENYLSYYNMALPQVRPGGFIIADNVLWSGKVIDSKVDDNDTEQIRIFNYTVNKDPRVENTLFPIRDGLMILRKK